MDIHPRRWSPSLVNLSATFVVSLIREHRLYYRIDDEM